MPNPLETHERSAYVAVNGAEVRRRRINAGESLSEFATRLDLSQAYVSQIELSGPGGRYPDRRVSPAVFKRLCDALGMKPDELRAAA